MAPVSYIRSCLWCFPQFWRQLCSINNNTIYFWPSASVFRPVFFTRLSLKYLSSSSSYWKDNPCRVQDAFDLRAPLSLPASPPAPVHWDEKVRQGQRPQRSETQTQTGQVWLYYCVLFHLHRLPHGRPRIHYLCLKTTRVRVAGRHSRSGPSKLAAADCSESTESREVFVDCQDRRLTSVPTSQTWSKQPKHLLLARNHIKFLRDGAFSGYEGLISLDLQQNEILLVEEGAFQGLTHLTTLLLQHNRLGTLSEEALIPMHNLAYLRLYDNPWNCLCPMDNLIRTLQVPSNRNLGNHARWVIPLRVWHHEINHSQFYRWTSPCWMWLQIPRLISPWLTVVPLPGVQSPSC